jgi:polyhydroxyalkanoate synthesis repressor PhaR
MIIIKRYPNRKLYNTIAKQYVTLERIADLIRQGEEVKITDHRSGEDLTAVTLSQIIFEQEKKGGGFLPPSVLTGLVKFGGETIGNIGRFLVSPLEFSKNVDQEIKDRLSKLVELGEISEQQGFELEEKLLSVRQHLKEHKLLLEIMIEDLFTNHGIPGRSDLTLLNHRLDELNAKLDQLELDSE